MDNPCKDCGGAAHPATGCAYTPTYIICWSCALVRAKGLENWTNSKGMGKKCGLSFYAHVKGPEVKHGT